MADLTTQQRLVARITSAQRQLYGYILTLLADPAAAEDVLQETNLVLVEKAEQWDQAEDFVAWACRVAYFQSLAYFKRRRRDRLAFMDESTLSDLAGRTAAALEHHDRRLTAMRQCLTKLPESSRRLIALRYDGQFSIDQIATETTRSGGAIRVALHRARQMLLACIRKTLATDA
ncbi:sigma-70 family RNA polymerase sigma factor [Planctomycetales bacterium ZRK34]|nr:sigma-70 family RNA polymerase sigma factor [Planctomycetales bacterium ZRK34]